MVLDMSELAGSLREHQAARTRWFAGVINDALSPGPRIVREVFEGVGRGMRALWRVEDALRAGDYARAFVDATEAYVNLLDLAPVAHGVVRPMFYLRRSGHASTLGMAEPLARLGAKVTAVDADPVAIEAAKLHAAGSEVKVGYEVGTSDELAEAGRTFDLVLALEIIEHVADRDAFLATLSGLVKPGGLLVLSTLNRTLKSLALGVGMAEYVLKWVDPGTHDWRKFVKPSELARGLRGIGFEVADMTGLVFDPLRNEFRLSDSDVGVNYFMTARRAN